MNACSKLPSANYHFFISEIAAAELSMFTRLARFGCHRTKIITYAGCLALTVVHLCGSAAKDFPPPNKQTSTVSVCVCVNKH